MADREQFDEFVAARSGVVAVGLLVATTRRGRWLGLGLVAAAPLTYAVLAMAVLLSVGA